MTYIVKVLLLAVVVVGSFGKEDRILGGRSVNINAYPSMASLRYLSSGRVFCGGSIISNKHVITAAHCLYNEPRDYNNVRVHTGVSVTRSVSPGGVHNISHVHFHPNFNGAASFNGIYPYDIAVVVVAEPIPLNELQNVIELPGRPIFLDELGEVVGFGTVSYPELAYPMQLQKITMRIVPNPICAAAYDFRMLASQFCAYTREGTGTCIADGGDPFIVEGQLFGIVSFILPCAQGVPDMFTKVYNFLPFINGILRTT